VCSLLLGPSRSTSRAVSAAASAVALLGSGLGLAAAAGVGGAGCGGSGAGGARCPKRLSQSCRHRHAASRGVGRNSAAAHCPFFTGQTTGPTNKEQCHINAGVYCWGCRVAGMARRRLLRAECFPILLVCCLRAVHVVRPVHSSYTLRALTARDGRAKCAGRLEVW